jgi:hypothetical protein
MERAFSPLTPTQRFSWDVVPGWYKAAPLALAEAAGNHQQHRDALLIQRRTHTALTDLLACFILLTIRSPVLAAAGPGGVMTLPTFFDMKRVE